MKKASKNISGLGIDIVKINRLNQFAKNKGCPFIKKNYSSKEIAYCFSFKNPVPRLAGTIAAKEAVFKALSPKNLLYANIEIRRDKNAGPSAWLHGHRLNSVLLSISYTKRLAAAIAIRL